MYERFTDRARKIMMLANQEAIRFNHEYIGTEHILLGLVKEGSGLASMVLKNLDVDLRKIRLEVEKRVQSGPEMVTMGKLPQTPRAKKVIELAMQSAVELQNNYVGTEHIFLGLLRVDEGVAAQVLKNLGVTNEVALAALAELKQEPKESPQFWYVVTACSHHEGKQVFESRFVTRDIRDAIRELQRLVESCDHRHVDLGTTTRDPSVQSHAWSISIDEGFVVSPGPVRK